MPSVQFNDFYVSLCVLRVSPEGSGQVVVKKNTEAQSARRITEIFAFGPGACVRTATRDILAMRQEPRRTRMLMVKDGMLKR
jgi:hypothetical protein